MTTRTRSEAAERPMPMYADSPPRWYLGSLNDGLFITDRPPSPSGTDIPPDWGAGIGMALNVVALTTEQAQAIVDAHNEYAASESDR